MNQKVKSGIEILDEFFEEIKELDNVDISIAESLSQLYKQGKLTDANVKNMLQNLRESNENKG
ncbi:MAG: hypothetical protein GX660_13970 [Clostridiaceae bacterium]|nr:hypothetical protein [Clostridiaceae bacterium]